MNQIIKIKELVLRYADTIQTQNKVEFCNLWAKNSDCMLISITKQYQGIESIYQDFLVGRIQALYQEIKLVVEAVDIHILRAGLAIVVFQYHTECIRREDGECCGIQGLETQVVVKEGGEWKLQHIHYSK